MGRKPCRLWKKVEVNAFVRGFSFRKQYLYHAENLSELFGKSHGTFLTSCLVPFTEVLISWMEPLKFACPVHNNILEESPL